MEQFTRNEQRAILAELLVTFFFVLVGTMAIVSTGGGDLLIIALAFGLSILIGAAWAGGISGAHINPAVTVALLVAGKIRTNLAVAYIIAQIVGAIIASIVLWIAVGDLGDAVNLGANGVSDEINVGQALLIEGLLTAFLAWVVFNTAASNKGWGNLAPIAIGLTVLVIHLAAIPLTGASVNPARSIGPALISGELGDLWIYIVGPVAGGIAAGFFWNWWRCFGDEIQTPN